MDWFYPILAGAVQGPEAQKRIDALTDEEVEELASTLEQVPAGGIGQAIYFIVLGLYLVYRIITILWCAVALPFIEKNYSECLNVLWNDEED